MQPDFVNVLAQSSQAAGMTNAVQQQNALAQIYRTQGADILAGQPNAMNALASIDPTLALGIQDQRQTMAARTQAMELSQEEMRMRREANARAAEEWAMTLDANQRAAELQRGTEMMGRFIAAETPEAWSALMTSLGKPDVPFTERAAMIDRMRDPIDALARYDAQNAPQESTFIVAGEQAAEYGLPTNGQPYQITIVPGQGVRAEPIGTLPSGGTPSADEQAIARIMSVPNPATGQPFTREEAIVLIDLTQVSRDPVTGEAQIVNIAGLPGSGAAAADAETATPPPVQPPPVMPDFNVSNDAARAAFGVRGAAAGLANAVTDTLGLGNAFPEVSQAQREFSVAAERILADMAGAWERQPPSWVLRAQDALIPRPGSIFTGPDTAREMLSAIRADAEKELRDVQTALAGSISPTTRAQLELQQRALSSGISQMDRLTGQLAPATSGISSEDADFLRGLGLEP
jgi:hypothetical protein